MFNMSSILSAVDQRWEASISTFEDDEFSISELLWVVLFAAQRTAMCTKCHSLYWIHNFYALLKKKAVSRQTQEVDSCLMKVNRKT